MDTELISRIKSLKKPVRFEQIDVVHIVEDYVGTGLARDQVRSSLESQGLDVKDFPKHGLDGFEECDTELLLATYEFFARPFPIPTYRLVILVGFKEDHSVMMTAVYAAMMY